MSNILQAYMFIKSKCDDPNVGYSQKYRKGQTVDGKTYYDCSSLIAAGLTAGGFYNVNPWFTTRTMGKSLEALGFTKLPISSGMQAFDILWVEGHTEMCYSVNPLQAMGARNSSLPFKAQVSVHSTKASNWTYIYRWTNTPVNQWAARSGDLSADETLNNASMMINNFMQAGFSMESAAVMAAYADMQSKINPGKIVTQPDSAGLYMWRPSSLIRDYDPDWTNGDIQCRYIREQLQSLWHTSTFGYSIDDFKSMTNLDMLCFVFSDQFLYVGDIIDLHARAVTLFNYMHDSPLPPFIQFPLWLLCAVGKKKTNKEL